MVLASKLCRSDNQFWWCSVFSVKVCTILQYWSSFFLKYLEAFKDLGKGESVSHSVMSDFLWPHGLLPARVLCPWNFPGKNTGVGNHSPLQGIVWTRDQNGSSSLQAGSLTSETKYCYLLERMQYCFFLGLGIN